MVRYKRRKGLSVLETALNIVEEVAYANAELGVTEIAKSVGVAKGAVHRHLQTLVRRGYLAQSADTARYRIGVKFSVLGKRGPSGPNILTASEDPMRKLRDTFGEAVALSVPEDDGARVIAAARGSKDIELGVRLNRLLPYDGSAQGRIILAFGGTPSFTAKKKLPAKLAQQLSRARRQGWIDAPNEVLPGMNALAVPIFDADDTCIGALAVIGLFNTAQVKRKGLLDQLIAAATAISVSLGSRHNSGRQGGRPSISKSEN
jgi:DNA-binding IclR family transcriptional regulator